MQGAVVQQRMQQVLEMVGLWDRKDSPVRLFSGGMRRRLEIARGFLHSPRVLFLDEHTIGLDPQTRSSIWRYIRQLKEAEEITIFMTTHYMDEAEFCDRIATEDDDAAIAALAQRFAIEAQITEGAVTLFVEAGEAFVPRLFAELGVPIRSVSVSRPPLDDVFMAHTGRTIRDAEESGMTDSNRMVMQVMTGARR